MSKGDQFAVGFLTVLEHRRHGLFGGYLVLNRVGRPLEFHCTAPVKPNRTQQILYGPTLKSFYYGERIGLALIQKSALSPNCVLTDRADAISLSGHIKTPVGWLMADDADDTDDESAYRSEDYSDQAINEAGTATATISTKQTAGIGQPLEQKTLEVAGIGYRLAVPTPQSDRWSEIVQIFSADDIQFDLAEPFTRIREAIEEAGKSFRRN